MNPLESTLSGKNVQEPPKSKSLKSARIHAIHFAPEDKMLRFYLLENQQDEQLLTTEKLSDKTQNNSPKYLIISRGRLIYMFMDSHKRFCLGGRCNCVVT